MKSLVFALALGPLVLIAASAPPVVGNWQSTATVEGHTLHSAFHITQTEAGSLNGTMDSPDEGSSGMTLSKVAYKAPKLHFELDNDGLGTFDGTYDLAKDEIAGLWKKAGREFPLVLKRATK